ncbi:phosphotransferase [Oceanibacterium hippocampi]|uniref:Putative aminoglycoside phosphotransferase n=1 Tax=Oceanibacterium hippocampi TaxID=745714 RepID=A0A1Y5TXL0_9PROT|nr:phosphotransferase [Oceanibacterium hippocampi]SLN70429.1 Putative aminoglycoside phosphotransferase [Oceanibacterium hippocampi]
MSETIDEKAVPEGMETTAIRDGHAFDSAALARYLAGKLPGVAADGPLDISQFRGGQSNPTFLVRAGGRRYVLRKKPPGELLQSAHMIEREYRVFSALAGTDVAVPPVHLLCEDETVIGTPFYVMDYLEGRVFRDPALPGADPAERATIYDAMNEAMARLHAVDYAAAGLDSFGRPENYVARQIRLWTKQYRQAESETMEPIEKLIAWLPENIPAGEEHGIAHGDFRLENLVFHPEKPVVLAVLDWELATLGHPLCDVAYNCMIYNLPSSTPNLGGLADLDLARLGIPSEADYVAAYCRRTGRAGIEHFDFYKAFALFRFASIAQGVYSRAISGNASAPNALSVGRLARPLGEIGWAQVAARA